MIEDNALRGPTSTIPPDLTAGSTIETMNNAYIIEIKLEVRGGIRAPINNAPIKAANSSASTTVIAIEPARRVATSPNTSEPGSDKLNFVSHALALNARSNQLFKPLFNPLSNLIHYLIHYAPPLRGFGVKRPNQCNHRKA